MSDQPEDPNGTAEAAAEPAAEQPLATWAEAEEGPAWVEIAGEAESAAPGPAGPGAPPEQEAATPTEPADQEQPPAQVEAATEAGRARRPASLRDQYVADSERVPRRKLSAPAFPSAPPAPGSRVTTPVSEDEQPGNPGQEPHASRVPNPASLLGRFPKDTGKIPMDRLPLDKLPKEQLSVDRLRSLTKQRPEVGLGLAFAGGLVIATILKRLGRR